MFLSEIAAEIGDVQRLLETSLTSSSAVHRQACVNQASASLIKIIAKLNSEISRVNQLAMQEKLLTEDDLDPFDMRDPNDFH